MYLGYMHTGSMQVTVSLYIHVLYMYIGGVWDAHEYIHLINAQTWRIQVRTCLLYVQQPAISGEGVRAQLPAQVRSRMWYTPDRVVVRKLHHIHIIHVLCMWWYSAVVQTSPHPLAIIAVCFCCFSFFTSGPSAMCVFLKAAKLQQKLKFKAGSQSTVLQFQSGETSMFTRWADFYFSHFTRDAWETVDFWENTEWEGLEKYSLSKVYQQMQKW